jgi:hypothetical protein
MLTITVSAVFQSLPAGDFGSDAAVAPDTPAYVDLAEQLQGFLQGEVRTIGDCVRTPGYPLIILAIATGAEIDLKEVVLPIRNRAGTNNEGRRLVRRIILFQETAGFLIPIPLFIVAYHLTGSPFWAPLGSTVYFFDIASACYRFTVLTETVSVLTILMEFVALPAPIAGVFTGPRFAEIAVAPGELRERSILYFSLMSLAAFIAARRTGVRAGSCSASPSR